MVVLVALMLGATGALCDEEASCKCTIGGSVRDQQDNPLTGVKMELSGGLDAQVTDDLGRYEAVVATPGEYTVTPSKPGFRFEPPTAQVQTSPGDATVDFVGLADEPVADEAQPAPDALRVKNLTGEWLVKGKRAKLSMDGLNIPYVDWQDNWVFQAKGKVTAPSSGTWSVTGRTMTMKLSRRGAAQGLNRYLRELGVATDAKVLRVRKWQCTAKVNDTADRLTDGSIRMEIQVRYKGTRYDLAGTSDFVARKIGP